MLPAFFLFARRQFPYTVVLPACGAHHQHIFRFSDAVCGMVGRLQKGLQCNVKEWKQRAIRF